MIVTISAEPPYVTDYHSMPDFAASSITLDSDVCITIVTFLTLNAWILNFNLSAVSKFEHFYYQTGMAT